MSLETDRWGPLCSPLFFFSLCDMVVCGWRRRPAFLPFSVHVCQQKLPTFFLSTTHTNSYIYIYYNTPKYMYEVKLREMSITHLLLLLFSLLPCQDIFKRVNVLHILLNCGGITFNLISLHRNVSLRLSVTQNIYQLFK